MPTTYLLLAATSLLLACAAQPQQGTDPVVPTATLVKSKPGESAQRTAEPASKPETSTTPEESVAVAEAAPSTAVTESEPAATPAPAPSVHPLEVLTGRETAFLIDYANSGAKERAQTTCEAQARSDKKNESDEDATQEKLTACLAKERAKFTADVLRFRMDERGNGTLTIYRRNGSSLPEVHVAKVEYKEVDNNTVKVVVKGGISGARPICRERQDLDVKVPNGYSIELQDGVYGKLTYDAKIGLVGR